MKVSIAGSLLILIVLSSLIAQPIFIPFKGERELLKLSNWTDTEIANKGQRCGDYFLYEVVADQHLVTLKAQVTAEEERRAIYSELRIDTSGMLISLDESKSTPTGDWIYSEKETGRPQALLIRISHRDYAASPCLPRLESKQQVLSLYGTDQVKHVSTRVGEEIILTLQTIGLGHYETPRVSSSSVRFEGSYPSKEIVPGGPRQVYLFMSAAVGEAKVDIPHSAENRAYQITFHVKQN
jgi:hypothetical protein